ncbi:NUDIX hydrolase [Fulvivirga sediminis]|uniref:NUDIX hydrolase n=1 Tax=Fulvivirga sediminis TaxID=2803949 RepID=A0A937K1D7_9BACT|nr:NUDIX hydrolase [Fulvivirga sediminis]MBL3658509.1 NUDIX hydrolase [Fulvivirga sediminis]
MHRQDLINKLNAYRPEFEEEAKFRALFLSFVQANIDCFERSLQIGHVTGSAWILDLKREKTLLTHHAKLDRWLQLGGHADGDPDVEAVAMKEALEESGLTDIKLVSPEIFDIDIHTIPARKQDPEHLHYDIRFLFEADSSKPLQINHESNDLQWVPISDLHQYTTERSVLRMAEKTIALSGSDK